LIGKDATMSLRYAVIGADENFRDICLIRAVDPVPFIAEIKKRGIPVVDSLDPCKVP